MGSRVIMIGAAATRRRKGRRGHLSSRCRRRRGAADALRLQSAVRISLLPDRARAEDPVPRVSQSQASAGQLPPDLQLGPRSSEPVTRLMSELLSMIRAGRSRSSAWSSSTRCRAAGAMRARGDRSDPQTRVGGSRHARRQRRRYPHGPEPRRHAGRPARDPQVAWMTRVVVRGAGALRAAGRHQSSGERRRGDARRRLGGGCGLRPDQGLCRRHADAVRRRERAGLRGDPRAERLGRQNVAIFADVHDRTGVPLAPAASRRISITRSGSAAPTRRADRQELWDETLEFIASREGSSRRRRSSSAAASTPKNFAEVRAVADGVIVSSSLKDSGTAFGRFVPGKSRPSWRRQGAVRAMK